MYRPTEAQLAARRAWVNAVRVYPQSKSALCRYGSDGKPAGFCCLGVATHLFNPKHHRLEKNTYDATDSLGLQLPSDVAEWLGIQDGEEGFHVNDAEHPLSGEKVLRRWITTDDGLSGPDGPDVRNDSGQSREAISEALYEWFLAPYEEEDTDVSTD